MTKLLKQKWFMRLEISEKKPFAKTTNKQKDIARSINHGITPYFSRIPAI